MKYHFFIVAVLILTACQTTRIKGDQYKISPSASELGSIGESKTFLNLQNDFKARTLPRLENEIRLSIDIVPFNKKLAKIYDSKSVFNQIQSPINYVDSLAVKPELALVRISDITGFVGELNAVYNKDINELLSATREFQIVSSIVLVLPVEDLSKIRQADAYYLTNSQDKKYTISLYKQGKMTGVLDMSSGTIIAQKLGSFCWSERQRGQSYIADITDGNCKGTTTSRPKKRNTSKNLYKL